MYLKKGKVGKKRLQIPSFRSINIFQRTVYWQVGEMGFAWVPQIGLIVLFKLDLLSSNSILPPTSYIKKGKHQKCIGPLCLFTNDPTWPPPQSTLHNHHNSRTSNIPIITLWCLCKSKSTNRIIQILSEKTNNALSKISQLSCAFKKFEQKKQKSKYTHKQTFTLRLTALKNQRYLFWFHQ